MYFDKISQLNYTSPEKGLNSEWKYTIFTSYTCCHLVKPFYLKRCDLGSPQNIKYKSGYNYQNYFLIRVHFESIM